MSKLSDRFPISKFNYIPIGICFTVGLFFAYTNPQKISDLSCPKSEQSAAKTELLFGLSKSNGSKVTEQEFQQFIDREVTPRFPEGLTLVDATGQFKNAHNAIVKENSKLLLLIHSFDQRESDRIEQIRKTYVKQFQQESVLRVDESSCISF